MRYLPFRMRKSRGCVYPTIHCEANVEQLQPALSLQVGHVTYLEQAAALGTKLIIGVNSDASVRSLNKGPERPINPEWARVRVLEALRCVDAAIVFSDHTPLELILAIQPDILVKGGDYNPYETDQSNKTYMVGSKEVKAFGGTAIAIPLVEGFSTTNILSKR